MKECGKRKSHISSKLHMICISYNSGKHPVTKNFTPLHYTSLHLSTLTPLDWYSGTQTFYCKIAVAGQIVLFFYPNTPLHEEVLIRTLVTYVTHSRKPIGSALLTRDCMQSSPFVLYDMTQATNAHDSRPLVLVTLIWSCINLGITAFQGNYFPPCGRCRSWRISNAAIQCHSPFRPEAI